MVFNPNGTINGGKMQLRIKEENAGIRLRESVR
jgi:hypothetical protein